MKVCHVAAAWVHCWGPGQVGQTITSGQSQRTEIHWAESDMVHLCASASEDGLRLASVQKGSQKFFVNSRNSIVEHGHFTTTTKTQNSFN